MLVKPGLQRALRTELVGLKCFPSHLLPAQQCLQNQITPHQGKLGLGGNKTSPCEMCETTSLACLAKSQEVFLWWVCSTSYSTLNGVWMLMLRREAAPKLNPRGCLCSPMGAFPLGFNMLQLLHGDCTPSVGLPQLP